MIIGIKDTLKLFGISIIACCAVFVCALFLNYNIDIVSIENEITTEAGILMYNAQVSMGKVTATVTGGCLVAISIVRKKLHDEIPPRVAQRCSRRLCYRLIHILMI